VTQRGIWTIRRLKGILLAGESIVDQDDNNLADHAQSQGLIRGIGLKSATALVIANIIGAGIFTSTGFQAGALGHPGYIFLLWIVGGVLAFCGALCYAELGAAMPRAGGEYVYLRETYGLSFGFMSAFVSLFAGFAAPIASALKSLVRYLTHFFPALASEPILWGFFNVNDWIAIGFAWMLVAIHLRGVRGGIRFNDWITLFKLSGIILIVVATVLVGKGQISNLTHVSPAYGALSPADRWGAFANSLIFVMFCYSGWNASAYVAGEIKDPRKNLPRSLMLGTAIVVVLYLALNAVYFYGANVDVLANKVEVGVIAANALFGGDGATLVTTVLSISLLASASAMTIAGPRVYYALGRDFAPFRIFARTNSATGAPAFSMLLQGVITSAMILSGRVDQIQQYVGFTLTLFASIAITCVIVLRFRRPEMTRPFKAWGYPFTPLLFLIISVWALIWNFRGRPVESILALGTVVLGGLLFYALSPRRIAANDEARMTNDE
jgi:basic amino acid/polyamine antiporter, APA family